MGRNWPDCIAEAKRRLAINGYLLIANTTKSLSKRLSKIKEVINTKGFEIYSHEEKGTLLLLKPARFKGTEYS